MWNILIVEDDKNDRTRLIDGLSQVANLTLAENGTEAITIFKKELKNKKTFDFVLLDVSMPNKDGFEVLKSIRATEEEIHRTRDQETCVIMITSFKDSLMENYNMGWNDFITKPVDVEKLIVRMKELTVPSA